MATLAVTAYGTTGANLNDTISGKITGQLATVTLVGSGGLGSDNLDLTFPNPLVPGAPQTVSSKFTNGGNVPLDVYMVFANNPALHGFNQLGTTANVKITINGVQVFASGNLNDGLQTGGTGPFTGCSDVVCPLPPVVPLLKNVLPGSINVMTFTFGYAFSFVSDGVHTAFNPYPVNSSGKVFGGSVSGGLPYSYVGLPDGSPQPPVVWSTT
jgi:hypothetical protein